MPWAETLGAAGVVRAIATAAFREARIDVPRYKGGDVAA